MKGFLYKEVAFSFIYNGKGLWYGLGMSVLFGLTYMLDSGRVSGTTMLTFMLNIFLTTGVLSSTLDDHRQGFMLYAAQSPVPAAYVLAKYIMLLLIGLLSLGLLLAYSFVEHAVTGQSGAWPAQAAFSARYAAAMALMPGVVLPVCLKWSATAVNYIAQFAILIPAMLWFMVQGGFLPQLAPVVATLLAQGWLVGLVLVVLFCAGCALSVGIFLRKSFD